MGLRLELTWVLAATLSVALGACGEQERCGPSGGTVTNIVDGDTIDIDAGGQEYRIRYLMIDTPESTGGRDDCYGLESKQLNSDMVRDRKVSLSYDVECTDRYDRLLAYVKVDGAEVNARLVALGYACVLIIPPNGSEKRKEYEALELEARSLDKGMWGACEEVTCDQ